MACTIVLDNTDTNYGPQATISGKVIVNLPSTGYVKKILCKIIGKEETKWSDTENLYDQRTKTNRSGIVHYRGENVLLDIKQTLAENIYLGPDIQEFPFVFTLPKKIPSTYKSEYGFIQYYINANVEKTASEIYENEVTINLNIPINFNDMRSELQMEPVVYQNEEIIWHCCYAGDPITMDLILEREAYTLDEPILFKLEVNNKSDHDVLQINVSLTLVIEATANSPRHSRKYYKNLLKGAKVDGLESTKKEIYPFRFELSPSTNIPNFIGSTLFRQKCILKAESKIYNSDTQLDVQTELKLGNIAIERQRRIVHPHGPVRRVHSSGAINRPLGFNFFNSSDSSASAPPPENVPSAPSKTTDDIDNLPPSYEDAIRATFAPRKSKKD